MQKKEWFQQKKYMLYTFGIVFVVSLFVQLLSGINEFAYGDSWDYWERGESLWRGNSFSLTNQRDGFRGYFFPLFLGISNRYFGGVFGYRIVNSLIYSVTFAVFLPELLDVKINNATKCIRGVMYYTLFTIFFVGLQIYALSDFFAIFLMLCCCLISKKILIAKSVRVFLLSVVLGMGIYLTYNVRTIYMFAGIYLGGYILWDICRKIDLKNGIFYIGGCISGICSAGVPQLYMNMKYLQEKSICIPTNGLMLKQLEWGIRHQRYDTYIGMQQEIPQMYFVDAMGENILKNEGLFETGLQSWGEYFQLLWHYPLEMVGIYTRHFLNMLIPVWPNLYVLDLDNNKIFLLVMSFSIFYIFTVACMLDCMDKKGWLNWMPLLVPMILIVPGAVEIRFFVPLYLLVLGMICFKLDWTKFRANVMMHKGQIVISYLIAFCIMVSIGGTVLASENAYCIFW